MYAELKQIVCSDCEVTQKPNCKICKKVRRSADRKARPEHWKRVDFEFDLLKHYGLSLYEYGHMYNDQNTCCDCCGKHESRFKRGLHVDHNKHTGQVRGLLCTQCNPGIGYFEHDISRIEMAIKYLKKFKK